jgi:ferredoxin-NADP reductase/Na+-translocating ferredoxin:NAD+ oxidoreductase RnfD subunit
MLTLIDNFLNRITMYRLVLYYLIALVAVAVVFGTFGILPYHPLDLLFSIAVLVGVSWVINKLFANAFRAQTNVESAYITALILALIITPVSPAQFSGIAFLVWAAVWAMVSKYILAIRKKHFFNPAAFAVALTAFTIGQSASWWVGGNIPMLAFVVIGGLLVVRKLQRFDLVIAFLAAATVSIVLTSTAGDPIGTLTKAFLFTPLFFFAFVMITEPLTTPPTRELRIAYGALVGFLFAPFVHFGSVYSTPELALIVGNVFSYFASPKGKYLFTLKEKNEVGSGTVDFVFVPDGKMKFQPGQYMEWTLSHPKTDTRGNRRYFTIASSPTERDLHLGVKFYEPASSFKKKMLALESGDRIMGGSLAGDFVLPEEKQKKLAFIAGGIGITPFRSMAKYLADRGEQRSVVMLYSNRNTEDIAYREIFDEAKEKIGMRTIYVVTGVDQISPVGDGKKLPERSFPSADSPRSERDEADLRRDAWKASQEGSTKSQPERGESDRKGTSSAVSRGRIDAAMIRREIPDYAERIFYVSGTHVMVVASHKIFRELGIPRSQIKTDFFPGFV